jgi:hypothetical protein
LEWIGHFKNPNLKVFVIHGEESTSLAFAQAIQNSYPFQVKVPEWKETILLIPPKARIAEPIPEAEEIPALIASLEDRLQAIKGYMGGLNVTQKEKIQELKTLLKNTEKYLTGLMK